MTDPKRFLVYGTLRPGNHAFKAFGIDHRATHLGEVRIEGTMYHLGGFPGVKLDGNPDGFVCDMYETSDDELMAQLDGYEGYRGHDNPGSLYLRQEITMPDGMAAYIYEYNQQVGDSPRMESGDWNKRNT